MNLSRPFALTTALLLAGTAHAATPQAEPGQSACAKATEDTTTAGAAARSSDADIDGSGACRLSNGSIGKGTFRTTGVSAANDWNGQQADPADRRLGSGNDGHGLGLHARVIVMDAASAPQVAAPDNWGNAAAIEPFAAQAGWYRTDETLAAVASGSAADDAGFVYSAAAAGVSPLDAPMGLTSRTGGTLDETTVIPAPVPEPGTWAMLLAGLAVLAAMARRRS